MNQEQTLDTFLGIIQEAAKCPQAIKSHEDWAIMIQERIGHPFIDGLIDLLGISPSKLFDSLYLNLMDAIHFPEDRSYWNPQDNTTEIKWEDGFAYAVAKKLEQEKPEYWLGRLGRDNIKDFLMEALDLKS